MNNLVNCFPDQISYDYKRSINRLFGDYHDLDIGLVDTSICQPHSLKTHVDPEDFRVIKSVFNIDDYSGVPKEQELDYYKSFNNYLVGHPNLMSIDSIVKKELPFNGFKSASRISRKLRKERYRTIEILENRVLHFNKDMEENYHDIFENLEFLKEDHGLSDVDYDLLCSSINAGAFCERVAMFSNDVELIKSLQRFNKNLAYKFTNRFRVPIRVVKAYTFLGEEYFYNHNGHHKELELHS